MKALVVFVSASVLVACAAGEPGHPVDAARPVKLDRVTAAPGLALHYDASLAADGFPNPLLRAKIPGQQDVWFVIDTGAGVHALAAWFVEARGLKSQATSALARGSTGQENALRSVADIDLAVDDGHEVHLGEAIVVDLPPVFEAHRLAGLISPQLLASAGQAAVLDMRAPSLRFESFEAALAGLGAQARSSGNGCRTDGSPFRNLLYTTPVSIDGAAAALVLDTGATRTTVAPESNAARALARRSIASGHVQGVGGTSAATRTVQAVTVDRGGSPAVLDLAIGASPSACGPDGLLGMDALRRCTLVLGPSSVALSCPGLPEKPAAPAAPARGES